MIDGKAMLGFLLVISTLLPATGRTQSDLTGAETSFLYIASTLQSFRNTGRLVNNPGIDGADLEAFLDLLEMYYQEFTNNFGSNSAMCRFYMDPENGRMEIEEKARLSFSFLPELEDRIKYYLVVDSQFQENLETEFGSILQANVNQQKLSSRSNQRLPSSEFEEAAVINFLDSACI